MSAAVTRDSARRRSHGILAGVTAAGCVLAYAIQPRFPLVLTLTIALGYLALLFLALGLLIGPWQLYRRRRSRNPVNLDLRRDLGIWTGITGGLHILLGLQLYAGGQWLRYFVAFDGTPLLNLFGLSNDLGAAAGLILAGLLALSNDWSLRRLRGPRWKAAQRSTYVLFPLVIGHTLGYQNYAVREHVMGYVAAGLIVLTLAGQGWGIVRHNRAQPTSPPTPSPTERGGVDDGPKIGL